MPADSLEATAPQPPEKRPWSDWWAPKLLTLLGLALIGAALVGAFAPEGPGPSKVVTTSTAATTVQGTITTPSSPTTTVTTSDPGRVDPRPAQTRVVTHTPKSTTATTTSAPAQHTTVETAQGHPARGDDTLVIFGFSAGLILLFSGLFYGKISEITLPGGWGVKFPSPVVQAQVAGQVSAKYGKDEADIAQTVYLLAMTKIMEEISGRRPEPPSATIAEAVDAAAEVVAVEEPQQGPPTA